MDSRREFLEEFFFMRAGAAGRDKAEGIAARSVDDRPVPPFDKADGEMPKFAGLFRGKGEDRARPECRHGNKAEAMFGLVTCVLGGVPIKLHT